MLEKLKQYKDYFKFYNQDNLPLGKECYLLSGKHLAVIEQQWLIYSSQSSESSVWNHPNELMDYIPCSVNPSDDPNLNIDLFLNYPHSFETTNIIIPKTSFIIGFLPYTSEKRPFIIVEQTVFEHLRQA